MKEIAIQPTKTFTLVNPDSFTGRRLEIQHDGRTFLWAHLRSSGLFSSSPPVTLRNDSYEGPIVAAAKYASFSHGLLVALGDPTDSPAIPWVELSRPMFGKEYQFEGPDGRPYLWRRTRNSSLGASWKSGGKDFKLLDVANGERLLAVFIHDTSCFSGICTGRIDWVEQLKPNTELIAMTAILMIQAQIRRRKAGANASAAGGAAAF